MKLLSPIFAFAATFLLCASAHCFEMSDVSVLLPLPTVDQLPLLLTADAAGAQGPLLPLSIRQNIPGITLDENSQITFSTLLKVVAIRIDPCFVEGTTPVACRRQIRFVWQPLIANSSGQVVAKDAALHSFYDLSADQWRDFLAAYAQLRSASTQAPGGALAINPDFTATSAQWATLKSLLLNYCGASTLSRVTTMGLGFSQNMWTFQGFDITHAGEPTQTMTQMMIPLVQMDLQTVTSSVLENVDYHMDIDPISQPEPGPTFYYDSTTVAQKFSEDQIRAFIGHELEFENPLKNNTGTLDCAGCHTAMATIDWAFNHYGTWDWKSLKHDHAFQSPLPLSAHFKSDLSSRLRAFGYLNAEPIIAPRTVNETANVLQALQSSSR